MPFIRLPNGIRVVLEYEVFGKVVVNVYHITTDDPIISVKLFDIAEVFELWWESALSDNFSRDISLFNIITTSLDEPNGPQVIYPVSPPVIGAVVADAVPNNVALVVTLNTAKTGRSFQGRSYLAGSAEEDVAANRVDIGMVAAILADFVQLEGYLDDADSTLVVASFVSESAPREEGVATPVVSYTMNTRVDTQRRRLPA